MAESVQTSAENVNDNAPACCYHCIRGGTALRSAPNEEYPQLAANLLRECASTLPIFHGPLAQPIFCAKLFRFVEQTRSRTRSSILVGENGVNIEQDLRRVCREAARLGLHTAITVQMLKQHGAIGAARRLLAQPDVLGTDLVQLAKLGRLDLTVEAVVLRNPQYFHEGEVVAALRRLGRYGYSIERYACKKPPGRS